MLRWPCHPLKWSLAVVLTIAANTWAATHSPQTDDDVLIGVLAYDDADVVQAQLEPLVASLQRQLSDIDFYLRVVDIDELEGMARGTQAAIIITNPYHYLLLRASGGLTDAFATIYRASPMGSVSSLGGTVVVPADRDKLTELADLQSATIAIGDRRNTGGFVLPLAELKRVGVEMDDIQWIESGSEISAIKALQRGDADAVFLRSSLLEALAERGELDLTSLRVLNRQQLGDYPFAVSTRLHPEWPLMATSGTDPELISRILGVGLLRSGGVVVTITGALSGISAPANYTGLTSELQSLGLPPYDERPEITLLEVLQTYKVGASVALALSFVILGLLAALFQRNRRLQSVWKELASSVKEQQQDQQRLAELNRHFELFLDRTTDYMYFKDAAARIVFASQSFARLVGAKDRRDVEGKTNSDVFPPELAEEYVRQEAKLLRTREPIVDQRQRFQRPDGSMGWVSTYKWPVLSPDGKDLIGLFGISRDITDLHNHEQQLERAAHYDSLTGLPNRALFFDRLHQAMASADRRDTQIAVVYLDIDKFKAINDEYGHAIGDELLIQVSELFTAQSRRSDTVARLGGDEFVFLIADFSSRKQCLKILDRLMAAIAKPRTAGNIAMEVTASAGIAFYDADMNIGSDHLLRQADQAMYRAKQAGRNRYRLLDQQQDNELRAFIEQLEEGLERKEFELHYQPLVDMRSGKIVGAESLVRWRRSNGELFMPGDFFPVLAGHPLAIELENWVLSEALEQHQRWRAKGLLLTMHVNVTATDISQPHFVSHLGSEIARIGCEVKDCFTLEILESAALAEPQKVNAVIASCAELGVNFALDDFGTGYSSLSHIKDVRANCVKIDQRFIQSMFASYDDFSLLTAIFAMSRAFDRQVVAEGVETLEQGAMLLRLGCGVAQGFAISQAMPADRFEVWAKEWKLPAQWQAVAGEFSSLLPEDWSGGKAAWLRHRS